MRNPDKSVEPVAVNEHFLIPNGSDLLFSWDL